VSFAVCYALRESNEEGAMRLKRGRRAALRVAAAVLALAAAGCGHLHWPWHHRPPTAPAPVHELEISGASSPDAFPQYWQRNTLLVDLSAASGSGSITLKPAAGSAWPVRLAFRVRPGAFGALEVRAAQRVVLPITPGGARPVDLELTPAVYTSTTPQMTVAWGATVGTD
jgi:hypothetical protein